MRKWAAVQHNNANSYFRTIFFLLFPPPAKKGGNQTTMTGTTTGRKGEVQVKICSLSVAFVYRHISGTSFKILQIIWCIISTFRAQQSSCFFCVIVVNMFTRCASLHTTDISKWEKKNFSLFLCCHLTLFLFDANFSFYSSRRYRIHIHSNQTKPNSNNKIHTTHTKPNKICK